MNPHSMLILIISVLAGFAGCGQFAESDADEDHHTEHFVPEHKPANFASAVDEIEARTEHLVAHAGHGHEDEAEELQQLIDIVEWIPELAADSDLNETDWKTAVAVSTKMTSLLNPVRTNPSLAEDLGESMESSVARLRPLIARAGKPEPAIGHDPDHASHHHAHAHPQD